MTADSRKGISILMGIILVIPLISAGIVYQQVLDERIPEGHLRKRIVYRIFFALSG